MSWLGAEQNNLDKRDEFEKTLANSILFYKLSARVDTIEKCLLDKNLDCIEHKKKTESIIDRHKQADAMVAGVDKLYAKIAYYGAVGGLLLAAASNLSKILEFLTKSISH